MFEDIARRRVDPGLLQTTLGNNYELRVYPLLPGKTRTVVLRIVEPAAARLQVPLAYAGRVADFELTLRVPGAASAPELAGGQMLGLRFEREAAGGFVARVAKNDVALPRRAAARPHDRWRGRRRGDRHRAARRRELLRARAAAGASAPRRAFCRAGCRSSGTRPGSAAHRKIDRELALLDAYFSAARDTGVNLVRVADTAAAPERFEVRGGDWSALRRALESTVYDGASNLGAVRHDGVSAEALWFSDGLANYGAPWRLAFPVPVFAINSAASSDPAALQALADASGGRSIDLDSDDAGVRPPTALLRRGNAGSRASARSAPGTIVVESHERGVGPARRRRRPDRGQRRADAAGFATPRAR